MSDENKTLDPELQEALKIIWDSLTDEQKEKAKTCKTPDELTKFVAKESIELPDEVLDAVAGGYVFHDDGGEFYTVIDDDGGVHEVYKTLEKAQKTAREHGYSTEVLNSEELKEFRRKRRIQKQLGC